MTGETGALRHPSKTACLTARIEHEQHVCRNVSEASELLSHTIFEHENVIELERGVVMTVRVECDDWKPDLLGKDLYCFLFFFGSWRRLWRRLRFGGLLAGALRGAKCQKRRHDQKPSCALQPEHLRNRLFDATRYTTLPKIKLCGPDP